MHTQKRRSKEEIHHYLNRANDIISNWFTATWIITFSFLSFFFKCTKSYWIVSYKLRPITVHWQLHIFVQLLFQISIFLFQIIKCLRRYNIDIILYSHVPQPQFPRTTEKIYMTICKCPMKRTGLATGSSILLGCQVALMSIMTYCLQKKPVKNNKQHFYFTFIMW